MPTPNDPLNLQVWKAEAEMPRHFQAEVWGRIAARSSDQPNFMTGWIGRLLLLLPRPAFAAALGVASIGLGLGLGHLAAVHTRATAWQEGQALYRASLNPLNHSSLE